MHSPMDGQARETHYEVASSYREPTREPTRELRAAAEPSQSVKSAFKFEISADHILSLAEVEKAYLAQVTRDTKCSKEHMAELLGINRKTLYRKQKEYSL